MEGGTISGNSAGYAGGGVYVNGGSFHKTGGFIGGDNDNTFGNGNSTDNTAGYGNTYGHAVFYRKDIWNSYYRDTTLESGVDISTATRRPTGMSRQKG
jgi:hypothetical protein